MIPLRFLATCVFLVASTSAATGVAPATRPTTFPTAASLSGKVFVGYQGWFAPAVEGTKIKWVHYGQDGQFKPGTSAVEMWPDVSTFDADERVPTDFRHADGRVAEVFSSANAKTVGRHFTWMRDHGIDGAFVQRFGGVVKNAAMRKNLDVVLANCRKASGDTGRAYAVMYDLSGMGQDDVNKVIQADWQRLVEQGVTADPSYLRHNGKPLAAVWGVGFSDGRKYDLDASRELVRFLKAGGNAVMLGVPYWWRGLHRDAVTDPRLLDLLAEADVISPWSVGRYGKPADATKRGEEVVKPDLEWAKAKGVAYMPVAFPGFGWTNLEKLRGRDGSKARIDRAGGQFFWSQVVAAKKAGTDMLYVAMFDEIDEGTAIMPVTNDPPVGETKFETFGGLPPDHYLWLAGEAGRVMRGERAAEDKMPVRK